MSSNPELAWQGQDTGLELSWSRSGPVPQAPKPSIRTELSVPHISVLSLVQSLFKSGFKYMYTDPPFKQVSSKFQLWVSHNLSTNSPEFTWIGNFQPGHCNMLANVLMEDVVASLRGEGNPIVQDPVLQWIRTPPNKDEGWRSWKRKSYRTKSVQQTASGPVLQFECPLFSL